MRALGSPPTIPSASIRNVVLPTVIRRPLNRPGTVGYGLFVRAWTILLISASDRPSAESTGADAVLMLTVPRLRAVSTSARAGLSSWPKYISGVIPLTWSNSSVSWKFPLRARYGTGSLR